MISFTKPYVLRYLFYVVILQAPLFLFAQTPNNYDVQVGAGYSVGALIQKGDTMFMGGDFDYVGFNTSSMVGVDVTTGAINASFPFANRTIRVTLPDGSGGFYIGGDFSTINGYRRIGLAHIRSDKSLDQSWSFDIDDGSGVYSLVLSPAGDILFVGGTFNTIGGVSKSKVAAINLVSKTVIAGWGPGLINQNWWTPAVVCAMAYYPGDMSNAPKLIIGGDFKSFNWTDNKSSMAALNPATGALITSWKADLIPCGNSITTNPEGLLARTLMIVGKDLYVGGLFKGVQDGAGTTFNEQSFFRMDVRGNGTCDQNYRPMIQPATEAGLVNCMKVVNDGSGILKVAIGGKFTSVHTMQTYNFALVESYAGSLAGTGKYNGGTDKPVCYLLDTIPTAPGTYAPGEVYSFDIVNNIAYLGGNFEAVYTDAVWLTPASRRIRRNLAAFNMLNNTVLNWAPVMQTNMPVRAITVSGSEAFVAGSFTSAGGELRRNMAAVNLSTHTVLPFNPSPDSYVNAFEFSPRKDTLYVGGNFANIGPAPLSQRGYVAAYKTATGALLAWGPTTGSGGGVEDIALDTVHHILYAGGKFTVIGGKTRKYLAALNSSDGTIINNWTADVGFINAQITPVRSIAVTADGDTVFVGGRFDNINDGSGAQVRHNLVALKTTITSSPAGATAMVISSWDFPVTPVTTTPDIGVNAVVLDKGRLYVGGKFKDIGGNTAIQNLAAISITSSPDVLDATWHPKVEYGGINCIVPVDGVLYVGGDMGSVNSIATSGVAAVSVADGSTIGAFLPYPTKLPFGNAIFAILVNTNDIYIGGSQEYMTYGFNDAVFHIATVKNILGVLPFKLDYFTAARVDRAARLQWKINALDGNLEVQRSSDGTGFETLMLCTAGQVSYTDKTVQNGNTYYYRLRIVPAKGGISYSPVKRVVFNGNDSNMQLPAWMLNSNTFRVITPEKGYSLQLLTINGQVVLRAELQTGQNDIALHHLPGGIYVYDIFKNGHHFHAAKIMIR